MAIFKPKKTKASSIFNPRKDRDKLYDKTWFKYRLIFLRSNPKCYCCGKPATVVDHIVAHKGDVEKFKNTTNHLPMCKFDHDTITSRFDRHESPLIEDKMKYIEQRRIFTGTSVSVKVMKRYGEK